MLIEGQLLLCQPVGNRKGSPFGVTVKKVGRKWATLVRGSVEVCRIDKETLAVDSGDLSVWYRIWTSRDEFEQAVTRQQLWDRLKHKLVPASVPVGYAIDQLEAALAALGEGKTGMLAHSPVSPAATLSAG